MPTSISRNGTVQLRLAGRQLVATAGSDYCSPKKGVCRICSLCLSLLAMTALSTTACTSPSQPGPTTSAPADARRAAHLAVIEAAKGGDLDRVRQLVASFPDCVDAKDKNWLTPLMWSACLGHDGVAEVLVTAYADTRARDKNGETALHYAASYNKVAVARVLLNSLAIVDSKNLNGNTPLHFAAFHGSQEMASLLLEHPADRYSLNNEDQYPVNLAQDSGHKLVADLLKLLGLPCVPQVIPREVTEPNRVPMLKQNLEALTGAPILAGKCACRFRNRAGGSVLIIIQSENRSGSFFLQDGDIAGFAIAPPAKYKFLCVYENEPDALYELRQTYVGHSQVSHGFTIPGPSGSTAPEPKTHVGGSRDTGYTITETFTISPRKIR